jgi:RNA polymerase sigma factor (sigma-70 family)
MPSAAAILLPYIRRWAGAPAVDGLPDRELLRRFTRDRDGQAFAALLRRHGPMAWAACRRVLPRAADAEDVLQKTFLLLAQKAAGLRDHDTVGGWLYGVAYRLALRARSEAAVRADREGRTPPRAPSDPLADITRRETQQLFDEALARLPEKFRAVLVLCCLEGRTQGEAARQLGCSLRTLKRRLEEGRTRLGQQLVRHGLTLPAAALAATLAPRADAALPPALTAAVLRAVTGAPIADLVGRGAGGLLVSRRRFAVAALAIPVAVAAGGVAFWTASPREDPPVPPDPQPPVPGRVVPRPGFDLAGDPLPEGAVARIGSRRLWADCGRVGAIGFASERRLVTLADDGKVRLWDVETGKEIVSFSWGGPPLLSSGYVVPVSADGKRFAFLGRGKDPNKGTDGIIHIHETDKGAEVARIEAGSDVGPLAFSADGKLLAATNFLSADKIRIYAVDGGKEITPVGDGKLRTLGIAFSPDGKTLAMSEADKSITLWDIATAKMPLRMEGGHDESLYRLLAMAFSADGKSVVTIELYGMVRTLDATTGKETDAIRIPAARACLSPGAKYAAVVKDSNTVEVWDVAGRKMLFSWQGPGPHFKDGAFAEPFSYLPAAFSPDGKVLAVGNGPRVELRSVETGKELRPGHYDEVRVVALSPDGRVMGTDSGDGSRRLWDTTGRELARFDLDLLSMSPAERWFGFSEDGKDFMLTDGHWMRRLSAATGIEKDCAFLNRESRSLAASAVGKLFSIGVCDDGRTCLVDWANDNSREFRDDDETGPWGLVSGSAFSADGKAVAIAYKWGSTFAEPRNEQKVKVWDVANGKRLAAFDSGGPVALTPDGKTLATVGDKQPLGPGKAAKVRLWDVATGNELRQLDTVAEAFGSYGLPLALSPDGKLLATGGADGSVRLWDVATGNVVADLKGSQGRVTSLAFSAHGKLLASGGMDTTVLLWKVP